MIDFPLGEVPNESEAETSRFSQLRTFIQHFFQSLLRNLRRQG